MFDFEEWSEKVYQVIEQEGYDERKREQEVQNLWEELFRHEDDGYVQFLNQLLTLRKQDLNGENNHAKLEQLVNEMRENVTS